MEDVWKSRATLCIIGGGGVEDGMGEATFLFFLSQPQLNHKSTQPNITKVGSDMKMTLHHYPHHPPPGTQRQQYLSCYQPDFNQTFKVCFWD